ncbi:PaaI family thioesterase [Parvibaculum sp.]|jgi:acyl-coenzyme A thioesterase PaaI-like protein|uniref:PaaI family thioesterase n=1 Tax=Parvibaculum sp. TaxID=2024848 RepID=UPI000C654CD2|nr:PaaI family thioesterase [Parvibaculum sp.]MAM94997.1 thioesterase [Parvibaculum sp.]HCX68433.1 thioesterase [Rhodobiaceae bacterium]|tara:strand:+ start:5814 stop:6266 length:453 start_codon:yes stop_codon:yes gene_type:complete
MSDAKTAIDVNALLQAIPYARFLGITVDQRGNEITTVLHFSQRLIGNPVLPALHGGAIGAFLETTAVAQLAFEFAGAGNGKVVLPKPIGLTIDYLRSGKPVDTYGRAEITKQGRRVATVRAEAWQEDRSRPIAAAHGHFLLQVAEDAAAS